MNSVHKVTVGENLKRIRKDLGLRQHEVAGEDITRNLISLIENNKAVLYDTAANIMAKNINKKMSEKGLNIYIKPEDLLNPERYDARKKADEYILELENALINNSFSYDIEDLNELEAFLNKWDLVDKKVRIYELLGDIFYISNNKSKEYYYYFKALESSYDFPHMKERYILASKLAYTCIVTEKYDETISLCKYTLANQNDMPHVNRGTLNYNIGLAYKKLKEFDKSLEALNSAEKHFTLVNNIERIKNVLILKANCYYHIGDYDTAIENYFKVLDISDDSKYDEICILYINIIQIYIKKNDKENIEKFFDKVMLNLPYIHENSYYLPEIYSEISYIYYYLKNYEYSEKYLKAALALAKKAENQSLYKKLLSKLLDLYLSVNFTDKITDIKNELDLAIVNLKLNEDFNLLLNILLYYLKQKNYKETEELILKLIQKGREV